MTVSAKILWFLTAVAAVVFAVLYFSRAPEEPSPVADLVRANIAEVRGQEPAIERLSAELAVARAEIEGLRARLEQAENLVGVLEDSVDQAITTTEPAADQPQGTADEAKSPMQRMMDSMDSETMARMQTSNVMQVGYARLFKELGLETGDEAQVREILQSAAADHYGEVFERTKNGSSAEDLGTLNEHLRANVRDEVAAILDRDQLAFFDSYDIDREIVAGTLDVQLGMHAPGLTEESRVLVRDLIVEELRAPRDEPPQAPAGVQRAELDWQLRAFRNAEARLGALIDAEQMEQFRAFIDQQMNLMESMREMLGEEQSGEADNAADQ